ncbi:MAG: hypothetical protein NTY03_08500 [Candidatus Bathyarchaeota archaeon]|nr:hypothetical protein [Candidatus Bathyarchaeota archaeon]
MDAVSILYNIADKAARPMWGGNSWREAWGSVKAQFGLLFGVSKGKV